MANTGSLGGLFSGSQIQNALSALGQQVGPISQTPNAGAAPILSALSGSPAATPPLPTPPLVAPPIRDVSGEGLGIAPPSSAAPVPAAAAPTAPPTPSPAPPVPFLHSFLAQLFGNPQILQLLQRLGQQR